MARANGRRKVRLVDKQYQLGIAWRMMIAYFIFLAAGLALAFAPSVFILASNQDLSVIEPAATEFLVLHRRIWPAALFIGGCVFVYTLFVSHRVAGPIYRINSVLRDMIEGRYPDKVSLRRGDHFHTTADLLTELSRKLSAARQEQPAEKPAEEKQSKQ